MALPPGVTTATVTFGSAISYLGTQASISATVAADRSVVHAATGVSVHSAADGVSSAEGGPLSFQVPHVNQPGFVDSTGAATTHWSYVLSGTITFPTGHSIPFRRAFQVLQGQTDLDLDLLPDGPVTPGVSAPTPSVLSVAGLTGAVSPGALVGALGADLSATYARKWQPLTAYAAGVAVIAPDGTLVIANSSFTSGATYNGSNWHSLPSEVATQVGASETVTAAAATAADAAVDAEVAARQLLAAATETDAGVLVSVRDATDHRTFLEASDTTGGPTPYSAGLIAAALAAASGPSTISYVASGDSTTADAYGGGTTYPAKLAALLGKTVINNASGGRRASEVAIAAGGLAFPIAIPGRTIPAATTAVACTPTLPDTGPDSDRTYSVTVQGVRCALVYTKASNSWTLARAVAAGSATPVPATGAVAVSVATYSGPSYIHILWGGRNSTVDGAPAMLAAAGWMKDNKIPFLLVSVTNSTPEPSGSSGYSNVIAFNNSLRNAHPRQYVELRGRLITEGLALAGLTATAADTTAIAEDRIPPALLYDGLHPNDAGRIAIAAIIKDELTIRGLA